MGDRTSVWLEVVARLKPTVSAEQARAESDGLFQAYMADVKIGEQVGKMVVKRVELAPAGQGLGGLRRQFSKPLTVLMILAGLVLIAACVNMTNLMLARATSRQRDFAVRLAIGAGRGRLIRQTLTEALVLVGAGATLGTLFSRLGETALPSYFPGGTNTIVLDLPLNIPVL